MAVLFDAVGPSASGAGNAGPTTLGWTHTVGAGVTNGIILVGCSFDASSDSGVTMSATCATVTMTPVGAIVHSGGGTSGFLGVFSSAIGVATGANAIVVTASGTPEDLEGGSLSFSGVTGLGVPVPGTGTSGSTCTATVASNTSGNIIAGFVGNGDTISTVSSPGTSEFIINQKGSDGHGTGNAAGAISPATGSSVTITWNVTSVFYASLGVEVQGVTAVRKTESQTVLRQAVKRASLW